MMMTCKCWVFCCLPCLPHKPLSVSVSSTSAYHFGHSNRPRTKRLQHRWAVLLSVACTHRCKDTLTNAQTVAALAPVVKPPGCMPGLLNVHSKPSKATDSPTPECHMPLVTSAGHYQPPHRWTCNVVHQTPSKPLHTAFQPPLLVSVVALWTYMTDSTPSHPLLCPPPPSKWLANQQPHVRKDVQ